MDQIRLCCYQTQTGSSDPEGSHYWRHSSLDCHFLCGANSWSFIRDICLTTHYILVGVHNRPLAAYSRRKPHLALYPSCNFWIRSSCPSLQWAHKIRPTPRLSAPHSLVRVFYISKDYRTTIHDFLLFSRPLDLNYIFLFIECSLASGFLVRCHFSQDPFEVVGLASKCRVKFDERT